MTALYVNLNALQYPAIIIKRCDFSSIICSNGEDESFVRPFDAVHRVFYDM